MRRARHPAILAFEWASAANAAGLVIALRFARLQTAMLSGDLSGGPEASRMVSEKWAAGFEGWTAAGAYWPAYWGAAARGWTEAASVSTAMASAFLAPGARKARTNARRLSRT